MYKSKIHDTNNSIELLVREIRSTEPINGELRVKIQDAFVSHLSAYGITTNDEIRERSELVDSILIALGTFNKN
ncbi:hypothetical protein [Photobacterium leiognathi]|uniref:hypothetical protein n=1 Tax=Photobacterium leiognathi TaxID=553611 RepID=UPI0029813DD8|nr:hypothetical protein [Photobacterium leiognathi]